MKWFEAHTEAMWNVYGVNNGNVASIVYSNGMDYFVKHLDENAPEVVSRVCVELVRNGYYVIERIGDNKKFKEYNPGFELKKGYKLLVEINDEDDCYCGNGTFYAWEMYKYGKCRERGMTCACGRGCCCKDCIKDEHECHDTVIEFARA